ncbi:MAG: hypothetical protein NTY80_01895 [candidate division SR1 bacterium]|nr:hypothetical protein [candidate division SR1 bacterium]
MPKNKKKSPGRPKKEFISKKPKTKVKSGPGRPRKDQRNGINTPSPAVVGFVAKSVDASKKKDLIIFLLFLFSFVLFMVSLYFTFMRDKKVKEFAPSEIAEIANVDTGNIDYTKDTRSSNSDPAVEENTATVQATVQALAPEQQMIVDFYQAVNSIDTVAMRAMTDSHLKESNVFQTYYSKNWLSKFSATILAPKIVVTNIQEQATNSTNPNIKNFSYTLEYMLASTQQKITEERSTVLINKNNERKIGQLMCKTKGCSTMPFFNPDKYK